MKKFGLIGMAFIGVAVLVVSVVNVSLNNKSSNMSVVALKNWEALSDGDGESGNGKAQYKVTSAGPDIFRYYYENGSMSLSYDINTCRAEKCPTEVTVCLYTGTVSCTEVVTIKVSECEEEYNGCPQHAR